MMYFDIRIFLVVVVYTLLVFAIGHKLGTDSAIEEFDRILEKARKDLEELMNESIRIDVARHEVRRKDLSEHLSEPIMKYRDEHKELQDKVLHGEITVDEDVDEYNKLINKESEDMERSDPPGVPHEHI